MPRKQKLDPFHWHEALDRAHIVASLFADFVEEHPAVRQTPALQKAARGLTDRLVGFYQFVAAVDPKNQ